MGNKKMFFTYHDQLISTIDRQTFYLEQDDEENFEVSRYEILATIDRLHFMINPPKDITPIVISLFS